MDLLAHLTADTERFAAVLRDVAPSTPVPTCPGWTAADLAWHLTEVQWRWGRIAAERLTERPDGEPDRPATQDGVLDLLLEVSSTLRTALESTPDDVPVWSWVGPADIAWLRRRQAHEALVHRLDAEATAGVGTPAPVDAGLAVDGIDELMTVYVTGIPAWATFTPSGTHVAVAPDGTDLSWTLSLGRMSGTSPTSGRSYDLPAALEAPGADASLTLGGPAVALHAWLWGRGPVDEVVATGDTGLLDDLRALIADATQ